MVALVALIECAIGNRHDLVDPVAMQWRYRARAIERRAARAEVLCLGDSLIQYGIDAPVLARRLGREVGNHAVVAAPAAGSFFALHAAIEAGARPRLVVVDYAPFLLLPGYRLNRSFLPEMAGLGACLDLAWAAADPELAGNLTLGWMVPSVRTRAGARKWLTAQVAATAPARPARTRRPDLWLPGENEAVFDWFYPPTWQPGVDHERYVDRLLDLAAGLGATVVWLMPPVGASIRREWDALGLTDRYTRFAASVQARHPNLVVLDARAIPVTAADLLDPLHLNRPAAEAFTARVAEHLDPDRIGRGPRWINLEATPLAAVTPLIQTASGVQ